MSDTAILFPALALAWWSIVILAFVAYRRLTPSLSGEVPYTERIEQFRTGEPADTPSRIACANRNYVNLFESPILFYFTCIVLHVTATATALAVSLAWVFFAVRVVHSIIHLNSTRVLYRFAAFGISVIILCGLMAEMTRSLLWP